MYLKGFLILDIIAIFPFYAFDQHSSNSNSLVRIVRITKVTRVLRASKLFKLIKHIKSAEYIVKFLKTHSGAARLLGGVSFMLLMAHIVACMWYFTSKLDDFGPDTWVVRNSMIDKPKTHIYLASLYWAFTIPTTVGFGDIHAFTPLEMIFCIIWLIFGICFYSFLIGNLTSLLSNIDSKNNINNDKIEELEKFALNYGIDKEVFKAMKKDVRNRSKNVQMDA